MQLMQCVVGKYYKIYDEDQYKDKFGGQQIIYENEQEMDMDRRSGTTYTYS